MRDGRPDVVIIGGGIVGCAAAYYLGKAGVRATIVERDSVASHASGFALGALSPLGGAGIPEPLGPFSLEAYRLHCHLSHALKEETGIETEFELRTAMILAFSEEETRLIQARLSWQQAQPGFTVGWKTSEEVLALEPRLSREVVGGVMTQHVGLLDPYRLTLALLQAAERLGATLRHGNVEGLVFQGDQVRGVRLEREVLACDAVVVAMGPWTHSAGPWLGLKLPVEPLKGQVLRLRVERPPELYLSWGHSYAVSKPDGLTWVGTTEEHAGFHEGPTTQARDQILASVLEVLPFLEDAEVVRQTACLRPLTPDHLPILGLVSGKQGVVVATGAGRKGIHFGPIMGQVAAELVLKGSTPHDISALAPERVFHGALSATSSWDV
jgi:glycine oxidase